jgi:hypothetical protein
MNTEKNSESESVIYITEHNAEVEDDKCGSAGNIDRLTIPGLVKDYKRRSSRMPVA